MAGPSPRLTPPPHALLSAMLASFSHGMGLPAPSLLTPPQGWQQGGGSIRTALALRTAVESQLQHDLWDAIHRGSVFESALPPEWLHTDTPHVLPITPPPGDKRGARALHALWAHAAHTAFGFASSSAGDIRSRLTPGGVVDVVHNLLLSGMQGKESSSLAARALVAVFTGEDHPPFTPLVSSLRQVHPCAAPLQSVLRQALSASDAAALAGVMAAQETVQGVLGGAKCPDTSRSMSALASLSHALRRQDSLVVQVAPPGVSTAPPPSDSDRTAAPTARSYFQAAAVDAAASQGGEGGVAFVSSPCGRPFLPIRGSAPSAVSVRRHTFLPMAQKGIVLSARGQELPFDPLYTSMPVEGGCNTHSSGWHGAHVEATTLQELKERAQNTRTHAPSTTHVAVQAALFRLTPGVPDTTLIVDCEDTPDATHEPASPDTNAITPVVPPTAKAAAPVGTLSWGAFSVDWGMQGPSTQAAPSSGGSTTAGSEPPSGKGNTVTTVSLRIPAVRPGDVAAGSGSRGAQVTHTKQQQHPARPVLSFTSLVPDGGHDEPVRSGQPPPRTSSMGVLGGGSHDILLPRHRPPPPQRSMHGFSSSPVRSRGASAGVAAEIGSKPLSIGGRTGALWSRLQHGEGGSNGALGAGDAHMPSSLASASFSSSLLLEHFDDTTHGSTPAAGGGIGTPLRTALRGGSTSSLRAGLAPSSSGDLAVVSQSQPSLPAAGTGGGGSGGAPPRRGWAGGKGGATAGQVGPGSTTMTNAPAAAVRNASDAPGGSPACPTFAVLTPHKSIPGGGCLAARVPHTSAHLTAHTCSDPQHADDTPVQGSDVYVAGVGAGALLGVLASWSVQLPPP